MSAPDLSGLAIPDLALLDAVGLLGAAIYCGAYLLAVLDRVSSASPHFYLVRIVAASLVLASLVGAFNPAAALIQVFFIAASVVGVLRHRERGCRPAHSA